MAATGVAGADVAALLDDLSDGSERRFVELGKAAGERAVVAANSSSAGLPDAHLEIITNF